MKDVDSYEEKIICGLNGENDKIIRYSLCQSIKNNKVFYGIKVISVYNMESTVEVVKDISTDKEFVKNLIKYLSQNGVDDVCIRDVLKDLNFKV